MDPRGMMLSAASDMGNIWVCVTRISSCYARTPSAETLFTILFRNVSRLSVDI